VRLIVRRGWASSSSRRTRSTFPEKVLGQLGNRVQHGVCALSPPRDQKAVKSVAETMRANPKIDAAKAITELGVGEALVRSRRQGHAGITERALVLAPGSQIGPITPEDRRKLVEAQWWLAPTTRPSIETRHTNS